MSCCKQSHSCKLWEEVCGGGFRVFQPFFLLARRPGLIRKVTFALVECQQPLNAKIWSKSFSYLFLQPFPLLPSRKITHSQKTRFITNWEASALGRYRLTTNEWFPLACLLAAVFACVSVIIYFWWELLFKRSQISCSDLHPDDACPELCSWASVAKLVEAVEGCRRVGGGISWVVGCP